MKHQTNDGSMPRVCWDDTVGITRHSLNVDSMLGQRLRRFNIESTSGEYLMLAGMFTRWTCAAAGRLRCAVISSLRPLCVFGLGYGGSQWLL